MSSSKAGTHTRGFRPVPSGGGADTASAVAESTCTLIMGGGVEPSPACRGGSGGAGLNWSGSADSGGFVATRLRSDMADDVVGPAGCSIDVLVDATSGAGSSVSATELCAPPQQTPGL